MARRTKQKTNGFFKWILVLVFCCIGLGFFLQFKHQQNSPDLNKKILSLEKKYQTAIDKENELFEAEKGELEIQIQMLKTEIKILD